MNMPKLIDLRSDTVTKPTPEMRRAIAEAEVGDDVYGEDPTVNRLEEAAARVTGKEAAVFVPSGTMGNQIAINVHTRPGHEIVCDERSHIVLYEMGGPASNSGCVTRTIPTADGILTWEEIRKRVRTPSDHYRGTGLISLENTHNVAGGRVYPQEVVDEICGHAHELGIKVHLDGARVFNAAAYCRKPVSKLVEKFDSVMFCLSKGLGAPVGSMLAGSREFIKEARLVRKGLGGGMRQAGVLAAAGLLALENSPAGLAADHANARFLADSLAQMPGVTIDPGEVVTNILFFEVSETGLSCVDMSGRLRGKGVLANGVAGRMRMVTHYDVSREDCEHAVAAMRQVLEEARATVGAGR
jgi:threonine aldolase